jgi:hypothetical protein
MASILAVGVLSTSAFSTTASAANTVGNPGQKGSLLIYPNIRAGAGEDTLITLTNDAAVGTLLKCYYASSDPLSTPNTSTAAQIRPFKHFGDFTINITHNQPISWWASTGLAYANSQKSSGSVAPPFGNPFPDGATRVAGELKCWAITDGGSNQKSHNHLFGTASVFRQGQADEYTAYAFQNAAAQGANTATPGQLDLNATDYDQCPNILLGNFQASQVNGNQTRVTLASCNQDLRQAYTPTITKLTWTFFNQDENARTGTHFCADSWFETNFPAANWPYTTLLGLGTEVGYFRIETTADQQICGPSTTRSAYVGVIEQANAAGNIRGTNLTGRGVINGVIKYDVSPPDSSIRVQ